MGASALPEGGLFVYTHLLVCVIPPCHVQACLLDTPQLLSLFFYVISYFRRAGRWKKIPPNAQNSCRSFSVEADRSPEVQTGEHLCPAARVPVAQALALMVFICCNPDVYIPALDKPWLVGKATLCPKPGINQPLPQTTVWCRERRRGLNARRRFWREERMGSPAPEQIPT